MFTRHVRKQLATSTEIVSDREKNIHQAGEWVCIFTRQTGILLAIGELASGCPHPWQKPNMLGELFSDLASEHSELPAIFKCWAS
jgi:hypothetical protein